MGPEASPGPTPGRNAYPHLPAVDFARLLSLLAVLGMHFTSLIPGAPAALEKFFRNGPYGVTCFFVISGFVITRRILKESPDLTRLSLRSFYIQRAARILPLLFLVIAIGIWCTFLHPFPGAIEGVFRRDQAHFTPGFFISIFTFTFNWFGIFHFGYWGIYWEVLWSLAVEEQFYLFYPAFLKTIGRREWVTKALWGFVLAGFLFRLWAAVWRPWDYLLGSTSTYAALDSLALGALAAHHLDRRPSSSPAQERQLRWLGALGALGVAMVYLHSDYLSPFHRPLGILLISLGTAAFLYASPSLSIFSRPLGRWVSWTGKYSYGGYLYHSLVLALVVPLVRTRSGLGGLGFYLAATLLLAGISFELFEYPVNRAIRRRFGVSPSAL